YIQIRIRQGSQWSVPFRGNTVSRGKLGIEDDVFRYVGDGHITRGQMPASFAIDIECQAPRCPSQTERVKVSVIEIALGSGMMSAVCVRAPVPPHRMVVGGTTRRLDVFKDIHLYPGLLRIVGDGSNRWALHPERTLHTGLVMETDVSF